MAKIDKSQYTKSEWQRIKQARRLAKKADRHKKEFNQTIIRKPIEPKVNGSTAFVIGNGTSRFPIQLEKLKPLGKIYGCNALYREFTPDYLIAVDTRMVIEISKQGYQLQHPVYTNPNRSYQKIEGLNLFNPSKGWSSGPTAMWLASQHTYDTIYILGFDYKGLDKGRMVNNMYADTLNYKKTSDRATFYGNWLKQTSNILKENPKTTFIRVIASDNYKPAELNKFSNIKHINIEEFKKLYHIS